MNFKKILNLVIEDDDNLITIVAKTTKNNCGMTNSENVYILSFPPFRNQQTKNKERKEHYCYDNSSH